MPVALRSPQSKFETNRSTGFWVMIGQTNKQKKHRLQLYIYIYRLIIIMIKCDLIFHFTPIYSEALIWKFWRKKVENITNIKTKKDLIDLKWIEDSFFATKSDFLVSILLQTSVVDLIYFWILGTKVYRPRLKYLDLRLKYLDLGLKYLDLRLKYLDLCLKYLDWRLKYLDLLHNYLDSRLKYLDSRLIL